MTEKVIYEMFDNPPPPISWDEYKTRASKRLENLLDTSSNNENVFQKFLEENPAFVPGAFQITSPSGFIPYWGCLFSQPRLNGLFMRIPDFAWIARDSLTLAPVFIEIEAPVKKCFRKKNAIREQFTQAISQIKDWKTIIDKIDGHKDFYSYFNLPEGEIKRSFEPQYCLVFGRRNEYENDFIRSNRRFAEQTGNFKIISYDRLPELVDEKSKNLICAKMHNNEIKVISIPPTFQYGPTISENLLRWVNFKECIDKMEWTTNERKDFLKSRYDYWVDIGNEMKRGNVRHKNGIGVKVEFE